MESKTEFTLAVIIGSIIVFALLVSLVIIAAFYRRNIFRKNEVHQEELKLKEVEIEQKIQEISRNEEPSFTVICDRKEIQIKTRDVLFVKSLGNYIEIHTEDKKVVTREKLSNFVNLVPDPSEFLQIRRSFIVRIDKVEGKGSNELIIHGNTFKVGETYRNVLEKIEL